MTQTAVEFITENVYTLRKELEAGNKPLNDIIEHAEQLFKQQIMKAFQDGACVGYNQDATSEEQYYNSLYKQKA